MTSNIARFGVEKSLPGSKNSGAYVDLIPSFSVPGETELIELRGATLDFRLRQAGLKKGERAAVSKAIGNLAYLRESDSTSGVSPLYHLTVDDVREATVEELAQLPDSGRRTAAILKKLVG
jgi:hypothetical protein